LLGCLAARRLLSPGVLAAIRRAALLRPAAGLGRRSAGPPLGRVLRWVSLPAILAATGFGDDRRLPRTLVTDHGVDGDQQLAGDWGKRAFLRLPTAEGEQGEPHDPSDPRNGS